MKMITVVAKFEYENRWSDVIDWCVTEPQEAVSDGRIFADDEHGTATAIASGPWNVLDDDGTLLASCVSLEVAQIVAKALNQTSCHRKP